MRGRCDGGGVREYWRRGSSRRNAVNRTNPVVDSVQEGRAGQVQGAGKPARVGEGGPNEAGYQVSEREKAQMMIAEEINYVCVARARNRCFSGPFDYFQKIFHNVDGDCFSVHSAIVGCFSAP